jgi:hypothetical protein
MVAIHRYHLLKLILMNRLVLLIKLSLLITRNPLFEPIKKDGWIQSSLLYSNYDLDSLTNDSIGSLHLFY